MRQFPLHSQFRSARIAMLFACGWAGAVCSAAQPVRLELRIVPQAGNLPGQISDLSSCPPVTGMNQPLRFEVQYRILDLIPTDTLVPAGLGIGQLNIVLADASGNFGQFGRAPISRYEAQLADASPPTMLDTSGSPTAPFIDAAGLHRPFRGAIPGPAPNNSATANGELSASGISRITPASLSPSEQGNTNAGQNNQAWYGLYSFTWMWNSGSGTGTVLISAEFAADASTGNRFSCWFDGNNIPVSSPNATGASIAVPVSTGSSGACCTPGQACTVTSQPACMGLGGLFRGAGTPCTPTLCLCPADFNTSGDVTVQDVFDFLAAYFGLDSNADFNGSGGLSVQDIFDFLAAYFIPCV